MLDSGALLTWLDVCAQILAHGRSLRVFEDRGKLHRPVSSFPALGCSPLGHALTIHLQGKLPSHSPILARRRMGLTRRHGGVPLTGGSCFPPVLYRCVRVIDDDTCDPPAPRAGCYSRIMGTRKRKHHLLTKSARRFSAIIQVVLVLVGHWARRRYR